MGTGSVADVDAATSLRPAARVQAVGGDRHEHVTCGQERRREGINALVAAPNHFPTQTAIRREPEKNVVAQGYPRKRPNFRYGQMLITQFPARVAGKDASEDAAPFKLSGEVPKMESAWGR